MKIAPRTSLDLSQLEMGLRANNDAGSRAGSGNVISGGENSKFFEMLKNSVSEVNQGMVDGDKASLELATGKSSNIHETMLTVTKAELGFNMLVQMRNKAIEAYQEVMRMQV